MGQQKINTEKFQLIHADCLVAMNDMQANSIDAIITDPPYGLNFMGKNWDHGIPGPAFWQAALRVAKPGAHLLAFGGTRTFHRLAAAIEDAGWEIRDCLVWCYGSGFPKSMDVSKALDKVAGVEREVVGVNPHYCAGRKEFGVLQSVGDFRNNDRPCFAAEDATEKAKQLTAPTTDAAKQWHGWGTALKPAWEPVIMARKPLEGTVADNVLKYGCGGVNIDGSRIGKEQITIRGGSGGNVAPWKLTEINETRQGRYPANLLHDGSAEVLGCFPDNDHRRPSDTCESTTTMWGNGGAAVKQRHNDTGTAARFFQTCPPDAKRLIYCGKASKRDRDEGCEGLEEVMAMRYSEKAQGPLPQQTPSKPVSQRNHHPTVKPTTLMQYICRLITPPDGVILDPFTGSGSTGKAALAEGFRFIGIEKEAEYIEIARARLSCSADTPRQLSLF